MAESKDIEINQFPIVSSLSNKDYIVVSLDDGSQGRIKTSDLASVVAAAITPNQMMCKPFSVILNTAGWYHICQIIRAGIVIVSRDWWSGTPAAQFLTYNCHGQYGVNCFSKIGTETLITKFRISKDSNGYMFIDLYYNSSENNNYHFTVLDSAGIFIESCGTDANDCTLYGSELILQ